MTDAKSQRERNLFLDFAALLDLPVTDVSNPNEAGPETGVDIVVTLGDRRIGVQLTDYHADEDQTLGSKGRSIRSEEQRKAQKARQREGAQVYGSTSPANFLPPLVYRVKDKIAKASQHGCSTDELWLLVCAQDARFGATGATFIASSAVRLDELDIVLSPLLSTSRFDRMYLLLSLERVVYGWSKFTNWQKLREKIESDKARVRALQAKLFPH